MAPDSRATPGARPPRAWRLPPEIDREIAATAARLAELESERAASVAARRAAILADFDAGIGRPELCVRYDIGYASLATLLWKAGRRTATQRRPLKALTPAQQLAYRRARRAGIASLVARRIAEAVTS